MTAENKIILIKRLKSFGWRLGGMIAVAILSWIADNMNLLELPTSIEVVLGLIVGEVTKYLNSKQS
jgi:hypothetical protein